MASAGWNKLNLAPLKIYSSKHCITLEITIILPVFLKFTVFQMAAFSTFIITDFTSEKWILSPVDTFSPPPFFLLLLFCSCYKSFPPFCLNYMQMSVFSLETTELSNLKFHAYYSLTASFSVCFSFIPDHSSNNKQNMAFIIQRLLSFSRTQICPSKVLV